VPLDDAHAELPASPEPDRDEQASAHEALAAIAALPEAYRETLMLRFVAGLSGPEIAARTGLTHGSVRVNLHRGVAMLRERLTGGGPRA
jgi:RNA polymerase sigma-70 factor (ECF subfamily)